MQKVYHLVYNLHKYIGMGLKDLDMPYLLLVPIIVKPRDKYA